MQSLKHLLILAALLGQSCGSEDGTNRKTPTGTLVPGGDSSNNDGEINNNSGSAPDATTLSFFKDRVDFTAAELTDGVSNCSFVTDKASRLSSLIIPWPDDLKEFLARELKNRFPLQASMSDFLAGMYLVKDELFDDATNSGDGGGYAGLTCDRGKDNKGLIFLAEEILVNQRKKGGLGKWQSMQGVQYDYMLVEVPDQAFFTLVHEIFHAVDMKLFVQTKDTKSLQERDESIRLAWAEYDVPKWSRISMTTLKEVDMLAAYRSARKKYPLACRAKNQLPGLQLKDYTAQEIKTELSHLKNDTNFLVPYAMVNAAEDYAETMAAYVVGSSAKQWDKRIVYSQPIGDTLSGLTEIYRHDSGDIIKTSSKHRDKMCFFAEMTFGGNCDF
jgi:hypothetical protein